MNLLLRLYGGFDCKVFRETVKNFLRTRLSPPPLKATCSILNSRIIKGLMESPISLLWDGTASSSIVKSGV